MYSPEATENDQEYHKKLGQKTISDLEQECPIQPQELRSDLLSLNTI